MVDGGGFHFAHKNASDVEGLGCYCDCFLACPAMINTSSREEEAHGVRVDSVGVVYLFREVSIWWWRTGSNSSRDPGPAPEVLRCSRAWGRCFSEWVGLLRPVRAQSRTTAFGPTHR